MTAPRTRLILSPTDEAQWSARRTTDVRTGMAQGLKEYLEELVVVGIGQREIKLKQVVHTWSEPETPTVLPGACVYAADPGSYGEGSGDDAPLTPAIRSDQRFPDGSYFTLPDPLVQQYVVDLWCTDPVERMALTLGIEELCSPVDWMSGFRLELPHYHMARAEFLLIASAYTDSEGEGAKRVRRASFVLQGQCPRVRPMGKIPTAQVRTRIEIAELDGEYLPTTES